MWNNGENREGDRMGGDYKRRSFNSDEKRSFPTRRGYGTGVDSSSFRRPEGDRGGFRRPEGDRGGFRRGGSDRDRGGFKKPEPRPQIVHISLIKGALMPKYMTEGATGADIVYPGDKDLSIKSGEIMSVNTGIIPKGLPARLEVQVRSRSSLAAKGLLLLDPTSFSADDKDKELVLTFINLGSEPIHIKHHDRIGQLVFSFVQKVSIEIHKELPTTERNRGGFGSTNVEMDETTDNED